MESDETIDARNTRSTESENDCGEEMIADCERNAQSTESENDCSEMTSDCDYIDCDDEDDFIPFEDEEFVDECNHLYHEPYKTSSTRSPQPFIPDNTSMAEASRYFSAEFQQRFGDYPSHPTFFIGSLDEACMRAEDNKLLVIYLHHDDRIAANIFCSQVLCNDEIAHFLNEQTVLWAWDLTSDLNRTRFSNIVSDVFGSKGIDISDDAQNNLPALITVARCLGTYEIFSRLANPAPGVILEQLQAANRNLQTSIYGVYEQQIAIAVAAMEEWERTQSRQRAKLDSETDTKCLPTTSASRTFSPNYGVVEAKERLIHNCRRHGLRLHRLMPTDGNSFFHAVCDQLALINPLKACTHLELRHRVVEYLLQNPIIQGVHGTVDLRCAILGTTWGQYCERMRRESEWADSVVVHATAHMLHRNVMVLMSSPSADTCPVSSIEVPNSGSKPIRLGHIHEFQYQSLVDENSDDFDGSLKWKAQDTSEVKSTCSTQHVSQAPEDASQMDQETNVQDISPEDLSGQLQDTRNLDEETDAIVKPETLGRPIDHPLTSLQHTDTGETELSDKYGHGSQSDGHMDSKMESDESGISESQNIGGPETPSEDVPESPTPQDGDRDFQNETTSAAGMINVEDVQVDIHSPTVEGVQLDIHSPTTQYFSPRE